MPRNKFTCHISGHVEKDERIVLQLEKTLLRAFDLEISHYFRHSSLQRDHGIFCTCKGDILWWFYIFRDQNKNERVERWQKINFFPLPQTSIKIFFIYKFRKIKVNFLRPTLSFGVSKCGNKSAIFVGLFTFKYKFTQYDKISKIFRIIRFWITPEALLVYI